MTKVNKIQKAPKNVVWEEFFRVHGDQITKDIEGKGMYTVTADELKAVSHSLNGPDLRLLTKLDRSGALPDVFKTGANSLSDYINILPLGYINKEYTFALGRFNAYAPLEYDQDQHPVSVKFPDVQAISPETISSESVFIDAAFTSGMLNQAFETDPKQPLMPVLHGRMGSGDMSFTAGIAKKIQVAVSSAQLEIDATFENQKSVVVIEAKAVPEPDFLVRQLYYPYYMLKNSRGVTKPIIPTFLVLLNGRYYFIQYEFLDPFNYSSIHKIGQKTFQFAETVVISFQDIENWFQEAVPIPEPHVPFPQADSYLQCIGTLALLNEAQDDENIGLIPKEIADSLGVGKRGYDVRQGRYYGDLLVYLGLASKYQDNMNGMLYSITQSGNDIYQVINTPEGREQFVRRLFQHVPFREAFKSLRNQPDIFLETDRLSQDIYDRVIEAVPSDSIWNTRTESFGVSDSTLRRRVQTVVALLRSFIRTAINN